MGRIFYVSSMHGDDTNSGQTPEDAFRSLRKINQLEIQPGDQIFLERGSVFIGEYLHLYAGGTKEVPVVVDAYGEGALPRIEADGNGIWYQNYGGIWTMWYIPGKAICLPRFSYTMQSTFPSGIWKSPTIHASKMNA